MKNIYTRPAIVTVAILLIPLIAMQFSEEVDWSPFDFVVMGVLIFLTGLGMELSVKSLKSPVQRTLAVVGLLFGFLVIWVELATGGVSRIFGM